MSESRSASRWTLADRARSGYAYVRVGSIHCVWISLGFVLQLSGAKGMHAAILWNQVSLNDSAADLDVLVQCVEVESSLRRLGFTTERIPCPLNLDTTRNRLRQARPDVVFNLVESLGGTDRLSSLAIILLESMHLKFTGTSGLAMLMATTKTRAKQRLFELQMPTAPWITSETSAWQGLRSESEQPTKVMVKAVAEHASFAMNDSSVMTLKPGPEGLATVLQRVRLESEKHQTPFFAENFIEGREFNLSVLANDGQPVVLPPAEIQFVGFPTDKPRIVGLNAKWNVDSMEYNNTPRTFDFPVSDQPLLDELEALARCCWVEFGLRGYARIDFRVDQDGQPWILEINPNPCLSPNAGFMAALSEAGIGFDEAVRRIVADAGV